ncbi:c-type cytochrome [Ekhidna sp. To15]|uniref:c-type cytochrome n=1 Tax=Ekhidna sp. To15 TaxID=3395267 RepID=UPI003F51FB03
MNKRQSPTRWLGYVPTIIFFATLLLFTLSCTQEEKKEPYLLGLGFGINSASMVVEDVQATRSYFMDTLGFNIRDNTSRGSYEGTIAVKATFPDNTVLEILSINDSINQDSLPALLRNFQFGKDQLITYAFSSSSADSTSRWLASLGYSMDTIESYRVSTETPDGWTWDTGSPQRRNLNFSSQDLNAYLPQFVEQTTFDYKTISKEWRTYYAYWRSFRKHPNGVVGIRAIRVAVANLNGVTDELKNMGFDIIASTEESTTFQVADRQELYIFSSEALAADTINSKVIGLTFEVENIDSTFTFLKKRLPIEALNLADSLPSLTLAAELAAGLEMKFIEEPEEQGSMAQMLSMNGELDSSAVAHASNLYQKYCALCHGENREGYAADNAPSLRSKSLLATSQETNFMRYTIQYGRANTAMGGYIDSRGGPLEYIDIEVLLKWLYDTAGVDEPLKLSRDQVLGDVDLGAQVYQANCTVCHGEKGEGISAPALGNPMLLATATDHFLRYAIAEGRDGTPMIAFKDSLSKDEIDGVTTFLRSRASGWDVPAGDSVKIPLPEDYVLNPDSNVPSFTLKEGKYLPAEQLKQAMDDSLRIVILDARSEVAWRQMHIPGAIPVPYYEEPENFIEDIPNDSTMIVVYCACPHAASQRVVNTLIREGFKNTAIMDEGILVWAQMGYPVRNGN